MNKPKANIWVKNASKSIAFSSLNVLKSITPNLSSTAISTADAAKDTISFIRNTKTLVNSQNRSLDSSSIGRQAKDVIASAMEDIRSGNFSLQKNQSDLYEISSDIDYYNNDYDSDTSSDDSDESGSDDTQSITEGDKVIGKAVLVGSNATVDSIKEMTNVLSSSTIKSAQMASLKQANIAMFGINKINSGIMAININLTSINQNIIGLMEFQNQNTSVVNQAMLEYFDKNLETLNRLEKSMDPNSDMSFPEDPLGFISGGFNPKGYKDFIKKNFNNTIVGSMFNMVKMMYDMQSAFGDNTPIRLPKILLEAGIKQTIPKGITKSLEKADKNLEAYFENALYRVGDIGNDYSKSSIMRFMGELLGAKRPNQKNVNMGNFHKEALSWNGEAQRSLVEVIPSYLASIESVLTKQEKRYYDMDAGVFRSKSSIEKQFYEDRDSTVQMEFYDSLNKMTTYLEDNMVQENEIKDIQQQLNELLNQRLSGTLDYKSYTTQASGILQNVLPNEEFKDVIMSMEKNLQSSIKAMNEQSKSLERTIEGSVYRNLFNNENSSKLNKERKIDLFENSGYGGTGTSSSPSSIKQDILDIAQSFPEFDSKFKITPQLMKKYNKAMRDNPFDMSIGEDIVKKELYSQLVKTKSKKFLDRFRISGVEKFGDTVEKKVNKADDYLFSKMMGYNKPQGTRNIEAELPDVDITTLVDNNTVKASTSKRQVAVDEKAPDELAARRRSKRGPPLANTAKIAPASSRLTNSGIGNQGISNDFLKKQESKFNNENYDSIMKKSSKDIDADLAMNKKVISENSEAKFETDKETASADDSRLGKFINAGTKMSDSIKASVLGMFSSFSGIVSKLFGKTGFFNKFWENENVKKLGNKIRSYLFNEKDGIFSGLTKMLLDSFDYLKYSFTGKEYTNRQGKKHKANPDSVLSNIKSGYNTTFDNTMKYVFKSDEYKENDIYKSMFSWMDITKKKEKNDEATVENTNTATNTSNNKENSNEAVIKNTTNASLLPMVITNEEVHDTVKEAVINTTDHIKESGTRFAVALFGDDKETPEEKEESFLKKFKKNLPRMLTAGIAGAGVSLLSGGSLGLLGGLFLPTGPVGGAIAGMGLSILSQSKTFQEFMFGKYSEKDGKKVGGLISQRLQDSFKKNLPVIIGAGTLGAMKHVVFGGPTGPFGVVANALLPGGPIGGALLGMGTGLFLNNDKIKSILFGEKNEDNKRVGGVLSKGMNKFSAGFAKSKPYLKSGLKGLGIGALTGLTLSKMGLVGSALSMGGPVGMGLVGLGLGIASQTDRFKQFLFGTEELDENGKPTGKRLKNGLLNEVRNSLVVNIFDPVKQTVHDEMTNFAYWAKDKIEYPFRLAFGPLVDALGGLKDDISDFVKEKFDTITDGITSIFKATMQKIFNPFTSLLGNIGKMTIKATSFGLKAASTPIVAAVRLGSMIAAPTRTKEEMKFWKNYAGASKDVLSAKWGKEDEEGIYSDNIFGNLQKLFGRAKDIKRVVSDKDTLDAARESYDERMGLEGRNSLRWRDVRKDKRENKEAQKKDRDEQNKWKRVDALRKKYAKEDQYKEVFWTDEMIKRRKNELVKAGLSTDSISTEKNLKDLIFNKDDWKDRFEKSKSSAEMPSGMGSSIKSPLMLESLEQKHAREKTSEYQDRMTGMVDDLRDAMYKMAEDQIHKDYSKKKKARKERTLNSAFKKYNINKNSGTMTDEDINKYSDVPNFEWDNYRQSEEYTRGDLKSWYNKNKSRWTDSPDEATIVSDDNSTIIPNSNEIMIRALSNSNIKRNSTDSNIIDADYSDIIGELGTAKNQPKKSSLLVNILDRLDSLNEVLFGGKYDRKKRDKNIGEPIDAEIIDSANISEDEMSTINNKGIKSLFNSIFKKNQSDSRKQREAVETEKSKSLKAKFTDLISSKVDTKKDEAKIITDDSENASITKISSGFGGMFGSVFDWFSNTDNITKLLLAGGGITLLKNKLPNLYTKIVDFMTESVLPTLSDKIPDAIGAISSAAGKYLPGIIESSAGLIVEIIPSLIKAGVAIVKGSGEKLYDSIAGSKVEEVDGKEAAEARKNGTNVKTYKNGKQVIGGSRIIFNEKTGKPETVQNEGLITGSLNTFRNSIANPKNARMMGSILGGVSGGAAGTVGGFIPGLKNVNLASGAKEGAKLGSRMFETPANLLRTTLNTSKGTKAVKDVAETIALKSMYASDALAATSKKKVLSFVDEVFKKLAELSTNKTIVKLFNRVPSGFTVFIKAMKDKLLTTLAKGSDTFFVKAASKIANATVEATAKVGTGVATIGLATLVFSGYDLISGAFEADKLFGVGEDSVDWLMIAISSTFKTILGLGIGPIFDILLEVTSEISKNDLKLDMATTVYEKLSKINGVSSADMVKELKANQQILDTETANYNSSNSTNLSTKAYQDLKNPSWATKSWNGLKNFGSSVKEAFKTPSGGNIGSGRLDYLYGNGQMANKKDNISYGPSQSDPRWANYSLGTLPNGKRSTMNTGGCGPTALSYVASNTTNRDIDPLTVAKLAKDSGYIAKGGSKEDLFTEGARKLGLQSSKVSKNNLIQNIKSGNPVILSGKSNGKMDSPFTKAGHVVAVTGIDSNGNVMIQDPLDGRIKSYNSDNIQQDMTNGWSYSKDKVNYGPGAPYKTSLPKLPSTMDFLNAQLPNKNKSTPNQPSLPALSIWDSAKSYKDEKVIENQAQFNTTEPTQKPKSSLLSGLSGLADILSKVGSIGTHWIDSLLGGATYTRIFNDNGMYIDEDGNINIDAIIDDSGSKDSSKFIDKILPGALKAKDKYGILPSVLIAQAILETGWGKSSIGNNIFGIKAGSGWTGKVQEKLTKEEDGYGNTYSTIAKFRDYDSIEDSILDYAKLMNSPRYSAVRSTKNYRVATSALQTAGYATDSKYSSKLNKIIESSNLSKYDIMQYGPRRSAGFNMGITYGEGGPDGNLSGAASIIDNLAIIEEAKMQMKLNNVSYSDAKQMVLASREANKATNTNSSGTKVPTDISNKAKPLMNTNTSIKNWFSKTLGGRLTSDYGMRKHPITGKYSKHTGIDFGASGGTPIPTPVSGRVILNGYDNSYGNKLLIKDNIGYHHLFAHMNSKSPIPENSSVSKGQIIGYVGTTGESTGNHLHYEVRANQKYGSDINPANYDINSIIEGYGALISDKDKENLLKADKSNKFNITSMNRVKDKDEDVLYGDAYQSRRLRKEDLINKLDIAVNTTGVEDKLNLLIDVVKDGIEFMRDKPDKAPIVYGEFNNNKSVKGAKPIIIANNKQSTSDKSQFSLREIHELIARGR